MNNNNNRSYWKFFYNTFIEYRRIKKVRPDVPFNRVYSLSSIIFSIILP